MSSLKTLALFTTFVLSLATAHSSSKYQPTSFDADQHKEVLITTSTLNQSEKDQKDLFVISPTKKILPHLATDPLDPSLFENFPTSSVDQLMIQDFGFGPVAGLIPRNLSCDDKFSWEKTLSTVGIDIVTGNTSVLYHLALDPYISQSAKRKLFDNQIPWLSGLHGALTDKGQLLWRTLKVNSTKDLNSSVLSFFGLPLDEYFKSVSAIFDTCGFALSDKGIYSHKLKSGPFSIYLEATKNESLKEAKSALNLNDYAESFIGKLATINRLIHGNISPQRDPKGERLRSLITQTCTNNEYLTSTLKSYKINTTQLNQLDLMISIPLQAIIALELTKKEFLAKNNQKNTSRPFDKHIGFYKHWLDVHQRKKDAELPLVHTEESLMLFYYNLGEAYKIDFKPH